MLNPCRKDQTIENQFDVGCMRRFVTLVFAIGVVAISAAKTVYVSPSGNNTDGTSWTRAYTSLSSAVGTAQGPTQIWVREGTYYDSATISVSGVEIYGGFKGTETLLSQRSGGATVIDGLNQTRVLRVNSADGVTFDRVTIRRGTVNWHGGGVYLYSATNSTLRDCVIENCTTTVTGNGGGIAVINGSATLTRVTIRNCQAAMAGGGLYELGAVLNADRLLIEDCSAPVGGGIGLINGDGVIKNSLIQHNTATSLGLEGGGGIYMRTVQRIAIAQNVISSNQANYGSALDCYDYTTTTISNNVINLNRAGTATNAVHGYGSSPYFYNNTVSDNTSTVGISGLYVWDTANAILRSELYTFNSGPKAALGRDLTSNWNWGYSSAFGNAHGTFDSPADADTNKNAVLYEDPLYLNRTYLGNPDSYQLTPTSPVRDYGQNNLSVDFGGAARPVNSRGWSVSYADKGAFEYQAVQQYAQLDGYAGSPSQAMLRFEVYDGQGKLISDMWAPRSANGFYLVPIDNSQNYALPLKILMSAKGYLKKKLLMPHVPSPLPAYLSPGIEFPDQTVPTVLMPGDTDGDNVVGSLDLNQVFVDFLRQDGSPGDIDGDGIVGNLDLNLILIHFSERGDD